MDKDRIVIGLTESVKIFAKKDSKSVVARIDTGATKSSIDASLAKELKLGPVIRTRLVKSASGNSVRPVIKAKIDLASKKMTADFTVADRSHMRYRMLIGQNVLKKGFLIDPLK